MLKKLLFVAAVLLTVGVLGPATAVAGAPVVLSGGGTGTFDGIHPGSQFGMGVVFRGGTVQGHFNCVMAGRSAVAGLRLMKVDGQVTAGSANTAAGSAIFSGIGTLHMNNAKSQVSFTVKVTRGGPGAGTSDRLIIQGNGSFNRNQASGGGTFDHFTACTAPPACPLVATGTWKAGDVVSWTPGTTHGVFQGGILVIHATVKPNGQPSI